MCGIAGVIQHEKDHALLGQMLQVMLHRGPDSGDQCWTTTRRWQIGLGSRRLAILDPSPAGDQPMVRDQDVLVYNGEVYNFADLRERLEPHRAVLQSKTDTEVVFAALRAKGARALRELNGMFALAYWNHREEELLLARDRLGIKPLYYRLLPSGGLVFASELKSLFLADVQVDLNPAMVMRYLSFGYVPGDDSIFDGIKKVPPGHVLRWSEGGTTVAAYRDIKFEPTAGIDQTEAAVELRSRLQDAVRRQLVADVPVGILLSGGLDSSSLLALIANESTAPVNAYTISFRGEDAEAEQNPADAFFAADMARHFGASLRTFEVAPDILDLLPQVAWHLDEPLGDPAAILTFIISKAARAESIVLLSGQGADELFAGYRVHQFHRAAEMLRILPPRGRSGLRKGIDLLPKIARSPHIPTGLLLAVHRSARMILDHAPLPPERRYVAFRSSYHFGTSLLSRLLTRDFLIDAAARDPHEHHIDLLMQHESDSFLHRMLYLDLRTFLKDQNLFYSDRLSMAASVEMRVPYLDDAVVDFALRLPAEIKLRGRIGKYILRRAVDGVVPQEVIRRRKAGFGAPVRRWLQKEMNDDARQLICRGTLVSHGIIEPSLPTRLLAAHKSGAEDHTYRIWTLLGLEMWAQNFLDRPPSRAATNGMLRLH